MEAFLFIFIFLKGSIETMSLNQLMRLVWVRGHQTASWSFEEFGIEWPSSAMREISLKRYQILEIDIQVIVQKPSWSDLLGGKIGFLLSY